MSTIFDGKDLDEIDDWLVSDYEFMNNCRLVNLHISISLAGRYEK